MLVLSRKKDESIVIKDRNGEVIASITIVRIDNKNKVRVGIEADDDVVVLRSELEKRTPIKIPESRKFIPATTAIANG